MYIENKFKSSEFIAHSSTLCEGVMRFIQETKCIVLLYVLYLKYREIQTLLLYKDAKGMSQRDFKMGVKEIERTYNIMIPMGDEYFYTDGVATLYLEGRKVFDTLR